MSKSNTCVATFKSHLEAEEAVKQLQQAGLDMRKLSIVGRHYHPEDHVVGYYNAGDRMKFWGKLGAFWGGIWGILFGSAVFWIPGLGSVLVGGPLVSAIVGGIEGATLTGGLSALGAGLYSLGVPRDSILRYESALKADAYLLIVHGDEADRGLARSILQIEETCAEEASAG